MDTPPPQPLQGILVVERAGRLAGGACAGLLLALGAEVVRFEDGDDPPPLALPEEGPARVDAFTRAGRQRLAYEPARFRAWLEVADVAIAAPFDPGCPATVAISEAPAHLIGCIITPYGKDEPAVGLPPHPDELALQAASGLMATTGEPGGPPVPAGVPLGELLAGINAATAVLAALHHRDGGGAGQMADIAIFDGLLALMGTFMPQVLQGAREPMRIGCRHPFVAPWNIYRTADGAVLICTANDGQWARLAEAMGQAGARDDPRFREMGGRQANVAALDALVEAWTHTLPGKEVITALDAVKVPVGPVLTIPELLRDESFLARGIAHEVLGEGGRRHTVALSAFALSRPRAALPGRVAPLEGDGAPPTRPLPATGRTEPGTLPLAGLRVIEVGTLTATPLATRNLAGLGAEVIKVEPAGGEPSRQWEPRAGGFGHFFTNNNADKLCLTLDLKQAQGRELFLRLAAKADALVENMRPGAMESLGLGEDTVRAANPAIVYCSESGFGLGGAGAGKAAYDTIIQGATGLMNLIAPHQPLKMGVSIADLIAAHFAPLAVLAALRVRAGGGGGQHLDLSMRDCTAWLTQFSWPDGAQGLPAWRIVAASDGHLLVQGSPETSTALPTEGEFVQETAAALAERLAAEGLTTTRVLELPEILAGPHIARRGLLPERKNRQGGRAAVFESPYRLGATPGRVRAIAGPAGSDRDAILRAAGITPEEAAAYAEAGAFGRAEAEPAPSPTGKRAL